MVEKRASIILNDIPQQLKLIIETYNKEVKNSDLVTATWQGIYDYWRDDAIIRGVELPEIKVPKLEIQEDELEKPVVDLEGNIIPTTMMYYPPELQGSNGLVIMGEMFPRLHSRTIKPNTPLRNIQEYTGWLNVENQLEAPYGDTNEIQLREHFMRLGREGMNENQYILFSQFMNLTQGNFIDNMILCRLIGSEMEGYVVNSRFGQNGDLHVNSHLRPSLRGWELGGRSIKTFT